MNSNSTSKRSNSRSSGQSSFDIQHEQSIYTPRRRRDSQSDSRSRSSYSDSRSDFPQSPPELRHLSRPHLPTLPVARQRYQETTRPSNPVPRSLHIHGSGQEYIHPQDGFMRPVRPPAPFEPLRSRPAPVCFSDSDPPLKRQSTQRRPDANSPLLLRRRDDMFRPSTPEQRFQAGATSIRLPINYPVRQEQYGTTPVQTHRWSPEPILRSDFDNVQRRSSNQHTPTRNQGPPRIQGIPHRLVQRSEIRGPRNEIPKDEREVAFERAGSILGPLVNAHTVQVLLRLQGPQMHRMEWELVRYVLERNEKARTDIRCLAVALEGRQLS